MADLPTGAVTFLFTDLAGSTRGGIRGSAPELLRRTHATPRRRPSGPPIALTVCAQISAPNVHRSTTAGRP